MNEKIKKLAEQAGLVLDGEHWFSAIQQADVRNDDLERFAELVRADERDKCAQDYLQDCADAVGAARLEEREACAKLCEGCMNQADPLIPVSTYQSGAFTIAEFLATAIRQRGEK